MFYITQIIERKRDGYENSPEELEFLLKGFLQGDVKDYQMSAWLMAVCCRGLTPSELNVWTELMWKSGKSFPRRGKPGVRRAYWIDKHSTGGVGDKTSLILVPLVVSVSHRVLGKKRTCIPMVSGRGLGHTGGTLDKLESLSGMKSLMDLSKAMDLLEQNGFFMMGQTKDLAPADRLLYALRDVTGTVESIPLIVSSIMSKKLAESLDGIVFDVKTGSGAFMRTEKDARLLATNLVSVAAKQGIDATALLTRMDEPLGYKIGNFLEVEECADYLKGTQRERSLHEVVLALATEMLVLASRGKLTAAKARAECEEELESPRPFALYKKMFTSQGGDWASYEQLQSRVQKLPKVVLRSEKKGFVSSIHVRDVGFFLNSLGGGRKQLGETVDPLVGIELHKKIGDGVGAGDAIMTVYFRRPGEEKRIRDEGLKLFTVNQAKRKNAVVVVGRIHS